MYIVGKITVTAVLPEKLKRLRDIAGNLWWSWNPEAIDLYRDIDLELWERLGKNPVRFLQEVSQSKLYSKITDPSFMERYMAVVQSFDRYLENTGTWFQNTYPDKQNHSIAYFSAEFGLNEVLPIYSGGLGVLSGDHCKSASDLGLPFTAVGLFYKQGYFSQHINRDGWQETHYTELNVSQLPISPAPDNTGGQLHISVELPGRAVYAKVWRVDIGRVRLYLMDTDVEQNSPADRSLTARLYGGDQETRIQQEIFLGIGGVRVLEALGIKPSVYHMNEGHSAFLGLELIRRLIQENGLTFSSAREAAASQLVFTTHTPVPAGNDMFPTHMIDKYFGNFWGLLGLSRHEFLDLGMKVSDNQNFNMTVLALTLAGRRNGVSKLHGAVTRNIFNSLWPGVAEEEIPIGHVTNGIHTLTWLSPGIKTLYDRYLRPGWNEVLYDEDTWSGIAAIPDEELWETHTALKLKMIHFVREKLKEQRIANGDSPEKIREAETVLHPDALTIGFARRFATYKRANLIFRDIERIKRILNKPSMPVQIVFAGKAHPADHPAHEVIKNINDIAAQEGFRGKVVLVENYNMTLARNLVQGVDIWLNNPRKPLEASGTSGQKVCINGVVNCSVLDGWWCEGFNGRNGWAIGDDALYDNEYHQDNADSEALYETLENHIIPLFYEKNDKGVPEKWVALMKESISSLSWRYSTHRMVQEYTNNMYAPSMDRTDKISENGYELARSLSDWKAFIERTWQQVRFLPEKSPDRFKEAATLSGEDILFEVCAELGEISPSDVKVELYYGKIGKNEDIVNAETKEMTFAGRNEDGTFRYTASLRLLDGGEYGYTYRLLPHSPGLINKFDPGLVRWAVQ